MPMPRCTHLKICRDALQLNAADEHWAINSDPGLEWLLFQQWQ